MHKKRTIRFISKTAVNTPNHASAKVDFIRKSKTKKNNKKFNYIL